MNYFVTHCDVHFLKYAERLFETLSLFSNNKIIFYTVDFNYKSKFTNVIPIEVNSKIYLHNFERYSKYSSIEETTKAYNVFLKPFLMRELLSTESDVKNNFCYLDADCLAINNCDNIFDKSSLIIDYPLFNKGCHDFMLINGRGDPFINNGYDLKLCLEADLMNLMGLDVGIRKQYLQTGIFLFNNKCKNFFNEWINICIKKEVVENWKYIAPFHEETVANCLMWQKSSIVDLSQSLINLPYNNYDYAKSLQKIKEMLNSLKNLRHEDYFIDTFCRIPSIENIKNLYFYHGKISDDEYNYIIQTMTSNFLLKINSVSLGDTLAATPTLRKLYNSYDKKIDVVTYHPELFLNNKYVNKVFAFDEKINENKYKEIFNTFLGLGGEKNKYGVEKKHNTIDIRQFHAIDLGFMLHENEMEYDYIANDYIEINNLPENYICLHVANTWPSRTYSDENWQTLINLINQKGFSVVLIGKNAYESGFYNIEKPTKKLNFLNGLDLTNKLSISQCWHVINKSKYFITMDSGLLHLAGTTDAEIIQLGSSINNKLRAPYRKGSQSYKYKYISGSCNIFCASDMKYGVKEWKTIQGVPPLINCLENKSSFECHPSPQNVINYISSDKEKNILVNKKRFLFIAPHLSTGGSPKYLEWLISNKIKEGFDIKVIEWNLYSPTYIVQRNEIIRMIGETNFLSVGHYTQDKNYFEEQTKFVIEYIKNFDPDFIHLNEFSENFAIANLTNELISFLYDKNRKFKLFETTHSAKTDVTKKLNLPDEVWVVSDFQYQKIKTTNIKSRLVEMNINVKIRPDRDLTLKNLNLDPNKIHVLQVGLFSINKNQKSIFDLAIKFLGKNIQFHFVGNSCYIDECNLNKDLENCKIWGERNDVDVFMSCMDVFVLPSFEELNPISLKEALSWNMMCFISDINTLRSIYSENDNLKFIKNNNLERYLFEKLPINNKNNYTFFIEQDTEPNNIQCRFTPTPTIEINGKEDIVYNVKFIDELTGSIHFQSNIRTNHWTACSTSYYCKWKIVVTNIKYGIEKIFNFDLNKKVIKITNESGSLGDSIAWMPIINEFQKKHDCIVHYFTPKKNLFDKQYPNINFYNYEDETFVHYYANFQIGCFEFGSKIPVDWREISLQQIAGRILNIDVPIEKTKVNVPNKYKLKYEKYVCIAMQSTSQSRYWNKKQGWEKIIDYLKNKGYKVICVDKHFSFGKDKFINTCPINIDEFVGNSDFDNVIDIINNCEFFIGLSSGLSWLAWSLNKKIIKINSSVTPQFEFFSPYTVFNDKVCNGCFNNKKYNFDASLWNWCPENKNFECSKNINEDQIMEKIDIIIDELKNKHKKIKIVHLQTTINTENEKKSQAFIEKFKNFGVEYINIKNKLYDGYDHFVNCKYPKLLNADSDDRLTNRHYGCFDSYRKAILNNFDNETDFLITCEGDCLFEISHEDFIKYLGKITEICEKENISYFSFGDSKTLESRILQSSIVEIPKDQGLCYITDKIIGSQCLMFNKNIRNLLIEDFKNKPWYVIDGWFNDFCYNNNLKMGIVFNRFASQYDGESFIDKRVKNF